MDSEVPSSFPINPFSDDKYRKNDAQEYKDLPSHHNEKDKESALNHPLSDEEILSLVKEVNVYFASFQQNLLVLIKKNESVTTFEVISSKNHELIRNMSLDELQELARNLRNSKLSLIDRNV